MSHVFFPQNCEERFQMWSEYYEVNHTMCRFTPVVNGVSTYTFYTYLLYLINHHYLSIVLYDTHICQILSVKLHQDDHEIFFLASLLVAVKIISNCVLNVTLNTTSSNRVFPYEYVFCRIQ